jgi:hypothetical protein
MTFSEFWPYYLSEHSKAGTKICHFIGTSLLIVLLLSAAFLRLPFLILAGIVLAYGFAWTGHFFIERNRPATFRYPFLSLRGDFKMCFLILTGKINLSGSVSSGTH